MWQFIALIVVGLLQITLGFAGIEYHLGGFWAFAAIVAALWLRFLLPVTIGSYFGAVDVMGWEWYVGVAIAAPGLLFVAPSMVMVALDGMKGLTHKPDGLDTKDNVSEGETSIKNYRSPHSLGQSTGVNCKGDSIMNLRQKDHIFRSLTSAEKEAAQILLDYDLQVQELFDGLVGVPEEIKENLLVALVKDPSGEIVEVRNRVLLQALGRPDLTWNDQLEMAIQKCRTARMEEVEEFFRVFSVLSRRQTIEEIRTRFLAPECRIFYVKSRSGRQVEINQRGEDVFEFVSIAGEIQRFTSMNDVYQYLGVPEK